MEKDEYLGFCRIAASWSRCFRGMAIKAVRASIARSSWMRAMVIRTGYAMLLLSWLNGASIAHAYGDIKAEFVNRLRDRIPPEGAVHGVIRATEGIGEVAVGYDVQSGAWYRIDGYAVRGQDCSGRGFSGSPNFRQVETHDFARAGANECLDSLLPIALLIDLVARPELIRDVERIDAGYLVHVEFPDGSREKAHAPDSSPHPAATPSRLWLRFDDECVVQFMSFLSPEEAKHGQALIRSRSAPPILAPVVDAVGASWKLASCSYEPVADCEKFDRAFVVAAAVELKVRLARPLATTPAAGPLSAPSPGGAGAGEYDPGADLSNRGTALGLGVVGLVFVSMGGAAWLRKRKSVAAAE